MMMTLKGKLWIAAITVGFSAGCNQGTSWSPLAPTPASVAAPVPADASLGEVEVAAVTHPSGSTLAVEDCGPSWTGIAGNHLCNQDWRGAFNVVVKRDLADVVLMVSFTDGSKPCGVIYVSGQAFTAEAERLVSTSTGLFFTHEPEGYENLAIVQRCELPRTTTRLVVQLWGRGNSVDPLLRREFDYAYTFVRQ